jgi:hypothetical protein
LFDFTTCPSSAPWELPGDTLGDGVLNVTCDVKHRILKKASVIKN